MGTNVHASETTQQRPGLAFGVSSGLVTAVVDITAGISFAVLIFTGPLAPYLSRGIAIVFVSAIVHALFAARYTARRGLISVVQDNPIVLLAATIAVITRMMGPGVALFGTVLALIALTTLLTAIVLMMLGYFQLGRLARYIPYPVIGGFLCGSGWLLISGAVNAMTGYPLQAASLPVLFSSSTLVLWVPGLAMGIVLFLANRRLNHTLVTPILLGAGLLGFYALLLLSGTSVEAASQMGLLLGPEASNVNWQFPVEIASADWAIVMSQLGSIAVIVLITVVDLLLGISGLEATLRKDVNLNSELRLNGMANLLSGLLGGMIGYPSLGVFAPGKRADKAATTISIVLASAYIVLLVFGTGLFAYLPKALVGGVLLALGLQFLDNWIVVGRKTMNRTDYSVVVLIFITIVLFGFLVGVTVGIILMIGLFVVNYSRLSIFHSTATGAEITSHVQRSANYQRALTDLGRQVYIMELDGFLFFGTANLILERVRQRVEDRDGAPLAFLVLDFRRVTSLDSSAAFSLSRVADLALNKHFSLILSSVSPSMRTQLKRIGLKFETDVRTYPDLDHALEECENALLLKAQVTRFHYALDVESQLVDNGLPKAGAQRLKPYLERLSFEAGQVMIGQNEPATSLYFIESGQVSQYLESESQRVRLQTSGPGTITGEVGLYLDSPRPASVIADEPTIAYRLDRSAIEAMKTSEPDLALQVNELIVRSVAGRLLAADREILALTRE